MKPERFTAYVFLCAIIGMMMLVPVSLIWKQTEKMTDDVSRKIVPVDWVKLYPFADGKPRSMPEKKSVYAYIKQKLEDYTSQYLIGYHNIVEASRRYKNAVNWNMSPVSEYNSVMRLSDGYLSGYVMSRDVARDAEAVKELSDFCAENKIDFMYINFPAKICRSEDKEISGVLDFTNQNADRLLALLKEAGVKYYDFREILHADGMKHHESFFITDHHWKPETGLWASRHILRILRDNLSWDVEPEILSPGNFEYVIYPEWFFGSQGKNATLSSARLDDFTVIYPEIRTLLKFKVPDADLEREGDMRITYEYGIKDIEKRDIYTRNPYHMYSYADRPLLMIENKLILNGKRLLVIHDSYSKCVVPFIALGLQYVDAIDLRYFTGSLRTFIEAERPDAVTVQYHSAYVGSELLYDLR